MIEQPKGRPGTSTHRELGFDFEETIGLIVLAVCVDSTVKKFSARITLRPDFETAVGYGVVLGGITGFIPDRIIPHGGVE